MEKRTIQTIQVNRSEVLPGLKQTVRVLQYPTVEDLVVVAAQGFILGKMVGMKSADLSLLAERLIDSRRGI